MIISNRAILKWIKDGRATPVTGVWEGGYNQSVDPDYIAIDDHRNHVVVHTPYNAEIYSLIEYQPRCKGVKHVT